MFQRITSSPLSNMLFILLIASYTHNSHCMDWILINTPIPEILAELGYPYQKDQKYFNQAVPAIKQANIEAFKTAIANLSDPNFLDPKTNATLLHIAAKYNTSALNILLKLGNKRDIEKALNIKDDTNCTPLSYVLRKNKNNFYKILNYATTQSIQLSDNQLIVDTVKNNFHRAIPTLINLGLDPDYQNPQTGFSPIHHAALGRKKCLEQLIKAKVNINAQTYQGITPLFLALTFEKTKCANFLLDQKPDVTVTSTDCDNKNDIKKGETALHEAAFWAGGPIILKLIELGGDVGKKTHYEYTPAHYAICAGNLAAFKILLQHDTTTDPWDLLKYTASELNEPLDEETDEHIAKLHKIRKTLHTHLKIPEPIKPKKIKKKITLNVHWLPDKNVTITKITSKKTIRGPILHNPNK